MQERKTFKYEIGDKTFTQSQLVLGQIRQLINITQGITIPLDAGPGEIIDALGDRLPKAFAIVLKEDGQPLKEKDVEKLTSDFEFEVELDIAMQIVEDFFLCNPIASLLEKFSGMASKLTMGASKLTGKMKDLANGLTKSLSSSQKETSQDENKSSGDTPSKSANRISSTAEEK